MGLIWRHTFYPYKLYLPLSQEDISRFTTEMPNVVLVPVDSTLTQLQRIDKALADCEGEYVAIVGSGFPMRDMWLEDSLYALINTPNNNEVFELEGSTKDLWAVVARKDHLQIARSKCPNLPIREGLLAAGVCVRRLKSDEIPFQFDSSLKEAQKNEGIGNWKQAVKIYEYIEQRYHNQLWMRSSAANALFQAGDFAKSAEIISGINQQRPTVDTLLLEAKLKRRNRDFDGALSLLKRAENILVGETLSDTSTQSTAKIYSKNG
jgi:tetratricopeptide (TPR) repeat protein